MGYLLVLLISTTCFAMDYYPGEYFDGIRLKRNVGEITVLEAPIFSEKSSDSAVIYYFRKGDKINVHPAEFEKRIYKDLLDISDKEVAQYKEEYQKEFPDPMFKGDEKIYYPEVGSLFYKVLLKSGRTGWILKDHIFLITSDYRESTQKVLAKDNTDYRIEEPLPKGFPLKQKTGVRGYGNLALGISRSASYPYTENTNQVAYGFTKAIEFSFLRNADFDATRRLFFGGQASIISFTNDFELKTRSATEEHTSIGVGPGLLYDLWKTDQYIFSLQGSLMINFLNFTSITQRDNTTKEKDQRDFTTFSMSPKVGIVFSKRDFYESFDLVLGTNVLFDLEKTYTAQTSAKNSSWWSGNNYDKSTSVETNYFIGIQTDY